MKYFVFTLVLCSGFLSKNVLSEKLESQEQLLDEKNLNLDYEAYNQENLFFEDPNKAACKCEKGGCVMEDGNEVCKCPPGFGNYTSSKCRACYCGPDSNCIFTSSYSTSSKVCLCNTGYAEQNRKCVDCECGPDSNCTWAEEGYKKITKKCHCKPGYNEENGKCVGPCSNNPCKNGGTCKDMENGYECLCPSEYRGQDCTYKAAPCNSNPCKNGGKCIDAGQSFSCECVEPYSGQTCETDPCTKQPCQNGGTCEVGQRGYICKCQSPFSGLSCENVPETSTLGTTDSSSLMTTILTSTVSNCYCGENSKSCRFDSKGDKECNCFHGYSENRGYCDECNCGPYGSCTFKNGQKQCECMPFTIEKHGVCVVIESTTPEDTTIVTSTILTSTAQECNCGPYGSCSFENGQKQCDCIPFAIEIHGVCVVMKSTKPEDTTVVTSTLLTSTRKECNCGPYGSCSVEYGQKQCHCIPFAIEILGVCVVMESTTPEDTTVVTSAILTSTVQECNCGPYGSCSFENGQKLCHCMLFAIEKNGVCVVMETTSSEDTTVATSTILISTAKDCNCGSFSYSCSMDSEDNIKCSCFFGYSQLGGICAECYCGPYGSCNFKYGQKQCDCRSFAFEKNGLCIVMETTSEEYTTYVSSTIPSSTPQECDCGSFSYSCSLDSVGNKLCGCFMGYSQLGGSCAECNCGPYGTCSFEYGWKKCNCRSFASEMNGLCVDVRTSSSEGATESFIMTTILSSTVQVMKTTSEEDTTYVSSTISPSTPQDCHCGIFSYSCSLDSADNKVCRCFMGYSQLDGICAEICSEAKCVHGKCEIIGKDFKCRCNEGFTGSRCEDKIPTKSNKQDLWKIILVSIAFAMFILLSGILCSMTRMRIKTSK